MPSAKPSSKGLLSFLLLLLAGGFAYYHLRPVPQRISSDAVRRPVLAVMVFENLNHQPELDFVGNALARDMIAKIGQLCSNGVDIIAHDSVAGYRNTRQPLQQVGRELGVDYILEGGARKDGDQLHLTVRLTRVSDRAKLWSEDYDCPLSETSQIQNQIIAKVASSLGLTINPSELEAMDRATTTSATAREAYMRGVDQCAVGSKSNPQTCIASFETAIKADPAYARALAALADAELRSKNDEIAEKYVRKAIETADATPQAHIVLGDILYQYRKDDKSAEQEFNKAIALNHSDADAYLDYAGFLLAKNRLDEAQVQIGHALDLDPLSLPPNLMSGRILTAAKMYDRAIQQLENCVAMDRDSPEIRFYLGEA